MPLAEKGDLLVGATTAMTEHGADVAMASYDVWDTTKWLASSDGHRIDQRIRECGAAMEANVNGEAETQRRSYPGIRGQFGTRGWELVRELDLLAQRRRASPRRRASCSPRRTCPSLDATDLIIGSEQMALQIHESVGHAVELDRILGWEAAFAGTSWLDLAQLGSLRFGSDLMNITADADAARRPGQLRLRRRGHAGASGRHRPRRHLGRRPLRSRLGGAGRPGLVRRRGARRRIQPAADGAHDQRRPAPGTSSLEEMIAATDDGAADRHEPLLVDRRQAPQLPVRLRDRLGDQGRQAWPHAARTRPTPASARASGERSTCSATSPSGRSGARRTAARASRGRSATPAIRRSPARFHGVRVGVR